MHELLHSALQLCWRSYKNQDPLCEHEHTRRIPYWFSRFTSILLLKCETCERKNIQNMNRVERRVLYPESHEVLYPDIP